MAPIAIDPPATLKAGSIPTGASSQYKNPVYSNPASYNAESEEKGLNGVAKAKYPNYLPSWDFDTKFVFTASAEDDLH